MNAIFPQVAAHNAPLLRAIAAGAAGSAKELAELGEVSQTNLNRKIDVLAGEGLISRAEGAATHQVTLTERGQLALDALAVFDGTAPARGGEPDLLLTSIDYSALNPRTSYDDSTIEELARSIADKGVLQPLLVRPVGDRFELVIGERRLRAAKWARTEGWVGQDFAVPCRVRAMTDDEAYEVAGVENLQREDLHWMDEAEFYKRLADKGRSAAQIERLVGKGGRKKRSIQELIQFARELDVEAKARTRLPDGDPARLSVDQCRAMVGNKRERPALDLTPKLACALLELLAAGDWMDPQGHASALASEGDEVRTALHRRPTGGPLITLNDRGLIRFKFDRDYLQAVAPVTEELLRYLDQIGFEADAEAALMKARAAIIGEMGAGVLAAEGRFLTEELNADPETETGPAPTPQDREAPPQTADAAEAEVARMLAEGAGAPAEEPSPAQAPAALAVTAAKALILTEVAHKMQRAGGERTPGVVGVECAGLYYKDPAAQELVYDRLLMFMPQGARCFVALTPTANDWLNGQGTMRGEDGRWQVSDEALTYLQVEAGHDPVGYTTPWLTVEVEPTAGAPAPMPAAPVPARDDFTRQMLAVTGESAAMARLAAAAREAMLVLESARSHRLKPAEIDPAVALIQSALDSAARYLSPAADPPAETEAHEDVALEDGELDETELHEAADSEAD